ncbi:hypothetical protein [Spirosoma validum]|uniref:Uncharacterized protein n=1 Tax=Spirosoma validum TaxID=2771355 RepID=A0A927AY71_9BACT|nr:hypothetical protein [Spirosoma validum]MBD2752015.1 hypothetical protein [Spirosoma validum]
MKITRELFDQQPLFIRQGALRLWGTPLVHRFDLCRNRHLYSFGDFFAEACFDPQNGKLTCICSFQRTERLTTYLDQVKLTTSA